MERDGLARIGLLDIDGALVRTPSLAFVESERVHAPEGALRLSRPLSSRKGDIRVSASSFSPDHSSADDRAHLRPGYRGSPYAGEPIKSDFAVLNNVAESLLDSEKFVASVAELKGGADLLRPTFCPVIGMPHRLAFLVYCGFDVLDSIPLVMSAENDIYLTSTGPLAYHKIEELPCSCPACSSGRRGKAQLLQHNEFTATNELRLIRHSISEGNLRELVEARVRSEPWLVQNLRLLDFHHYDLEEAHAPITGARFHAGSKESLSRPDVVRWRKRLEQRYKRPQSARILLLIPCSARKPYSLSQSHMRFRQAIWNSGRASSVHEVIVTSPLGLVPRELELFYPAKDYDIPVTGHWDRDEKMLIEEMVAWLLRTQKYDMVISHLGDESETVNAVLTDFTDTSKGNPGSHMSLERLEDALRQLPGTDTTARGGRDLEDMTSISRFQFGDAGDELCKGATVSGRWPGLKIFKNGVQMGMLTGDRGMISLTLDGGAALAETESYCVRIEDFIPKGNLFVVGVENASDEIRVGDDVVVVHDHDLRAVGVAKMPAVEMKLARRGEAVHVRHVLPSSP